ncbi:hypothetical protein CDD83_6047 [Cordyceps sp. RAO-2017]|nr:hypothetical protein CDD83_6047 [Cordyceps sp. RAO-2017]
MRLGKTFRVLSSAATDGRTARLGRLTFAGRRAIQTPNYTAVTSRGAVPHLTPDNLGKFTTVGAVYMALEDFVEKMEPPIYQTPVEDQARLHGFTALPSDRTTILAPRRCPAVLCPMGNSTTSVSLFTSTGFSSVTIPQYAAATENLQPDIVVPLSDSLHTSSTPASKKLMKMVERTEDWVDEYLQHLGGRERTDELGVSVFAPVLPVELPIQWGYLKHLAEDVTEALSGLAIYNVNILPELAGYDSLLPLPKLSLDPPATPHEVLRQVALGVDLCTIPFVNNVSDAGVALSFSFPPPSAAPAAPAESRLRPLGVDMWSADHSTLLTPLAEGCPCYTCTSHHRAFVHHLLNAREMLGWTLLQIHNQHVMGSFFTGIQRSLGEGLAHFEQVLDRFTAAYEPELPEGSGERPRARGYHFKSEVAQDKINKPGWADLDGKAVESA